jgi:hypothetical protein
MATYDDYDGVYFSIQALRMYHPEILSSVEFIVVDNNPSSAVSDHLRHFADAIDGLRYLPEAWRKGTAVRDMIFEKARGDFVLCMDSHVMFPAGALQSLLDYFDQHPDTIDLIQGPMFSDNLRDINSHWDPLWDEGMWGTWAHDKRANISDAEPFEIPMQGLGVFACRRDIWPYFNNNFSGFGGEEGYIHEKFRQRGGRAICLPSLRWLHRFARPLGVPYQISWRDRIRNYILGRVELGLAYDDVVEHMSEYVGADFTRDVVTDVRSEIERCTEVGARLN